MNSKPMIFFIRQIFFTALLLLAAPVLADFAFVHPGLLQSQEDIERMKKGIESKGLVISAGFQVFRSDKLSQSTYVMKGPGETIGRAPNANFGEFNDDAAAAYQNALMWCLTGDMAHASKAKEILNAWASRLRRVTGRDGVLMAGLGLSRWSMPRRCSVIPTPAGRRRIFASVRDVHQRDLS